MFNVYVFASLASISPVLRHIPRRVRIFERRPFNWTIPQIPQIPGGEWVLVWGGGVLACMVICVCVRGSGALFYNYQ